MIIAVAYKKVRKNWTLCQWKDIAMITWLVQAWELNLGLQVS